MASDRMRKLPDPPAPVVIHKLKNDGSERSQWEGELVAVEPEWLVVHHDAGRHTRRKAEASTEGNVPAHGLRYLGRRHPLAILFRFDEEGTLTGVQCDAARPAVIDGDALTFVDLDVDLIIEPGGTAYERDRDVFEANALRYGYDEASRAVMEAGMTLAAGLHASAAPPFDGSAERLLAARLGALVGTGG
jgi:protein associated with RNAse G/E